MNELRSRHLVEEMGLAAGAPPAVTHAVAAPSPEPPPEPPLAPAPAEPPEVGASARRDAASPATPADGQAPVPMDVLQRAGLALGGKGRTRIAEEFSVTAGALLRGLRAAQRDGPAAGSAGGPALAFGNLMLITSAKPGEGKTFSALNLAATLAHNGLARVVLVDIDSKPASLTALLGLDGRPGLFDLAADAALKPDALLVGTAVRDLSVLPLGSREGAHAHGLTRKLSTAVERIARRLAGQVVVLDASPCLATSEPAALAPMVGLVAMVVEAERTQREEVESALDMVATCPHVMLVLNKIRGTRGHAFGYYDYYGA
jgi:receptor protein-tyrosine kinase